MKMTFNIINANGTAFDTNIPIDYDNMNGIEIVKYIRANIDPDQLGVVFVDGKPDAIITLNGIYS